MSIKKLFNAYLDQHFIAFNSGAVGGLMRGGNKTIRFSKTDENRSAPKKAFKLLIAVAETEDDVPVMKDVSHAYRIFKKEGYDVEFVNSDGKPVRFRKSDLTDSVNRWFAEDASARYKLTHPLKVKDVRPGLFVGIYFAGSRDPQWETKWFRQLSERILKSNGVLAGFGAAKDAEKQFDLAGSIQNGYSLPDSRINRSGSVYGSSATNVATANDGWMVHKGEVIELAASSPNDLALSVVSQL